MPNVASASAARPKRFLTLPKSQTYRLTRCSTRMNTPCSPPQTTNVHAAPCQRPTSRKASEQVDFAAQPAAPIAAEREEHIVANPARQRHVPARPQLGHADRTERALEIHRKAETEHQRDADRAQRIPGEVAIGLQRERRRAEPAFAESGMGAGGEHAIDDRREHQVGQADLERQAVDEKREALADLDRAPGLGFRALRRKVAVAQDRSGDQVRKEGHVQAVVEQALRYGDAPAVDVDHVRQALEGVKRNADRQQDAERHRLEVDAEHVQQIDRGVGKELRVLEEAERAQVDRDRRGENRAAVRPGAGPGPSSATPASRIRSSR